MAIKYEVELISLPANNQRFPQAFFPHYYHYKSDAKSMVKLISELGGKAIIKVKHEDVYYRDMRGNRKLLV